MKLIESGLETSSGRRTSRRALAGGHDLEHEEKKTKPHRRGAAGVAEEAYTSRSFDMKVD